MVAFWPRFLRHVAPLLRMPFYEGTELAWGVHLEAGVGAGAHRGRCAVGGLYRRRGLVAGWRGRVLSDAGQRCEAVPHTGTGFHYLRPADVGMLLPGQATLHRVHGVQLGLNVRRDEGPEGPQHRLVLDLQPCTLIFDPGNKRLERLSGLGAHGIECNPALRWREAPVVFDH